MLKITVEGVYESDLGTNQKKYVDFNYTFKTSRLTAAGVHTHVEKRFIPMLVANDKSKKYLFSALRSYNIISIDSVKDDDTSIIGKDIDKLNAWELQDLACTFDLYDVPLNGRRPISAIKDKAISAYLRKVLKYNVDDLKEKAKLDCVVKNADGSYRYDFTNDKIIIQVPENYLLKAKKEEPKIKVSDLIKQTAQPEIAPVTPQSDSIPSTAESQGNENDFPSLDDLEGKNS